MLCVACIVQFVSDFMKLLHRSIYLCYKSIYLCYVLDIACIALILEFYHVVFGMNFIVSKPLHEASR